MTVLLVFSDISKYFKKIRNNNFFVFTDILLYFQNHQNSVSFTFPDILKNIKNDCFFLIFKYFEMFLTTAKTAFLSHFQRF